eukprot:2903277-Rhodomonas_salina.2
MDSGAGMACGGAGAAVEGARPASFPQPRPPPPQPLPDQLPPSGPTPPLPLLLPARLVGRGRGVGEGAVRRSKSGGKLLKRAERGSRGSACRGLREARGAARAGCRTRPRARQTEVGGGVRGGQLEKLKRAVLLKLAATSRSSPPSPSRLNVPPPPILLSLPPANTSCPRLLHHPRKDCVQRWCVTECDRGGAMWSAVSCVSECV